MIIDKYITRVVGKRNKAPNQRKRDKTAHNHKMENKSHAPVSKLNNRRRTKWTIRHNNVTNLALSATDPLPQTSG